MPPQDSTDVTFASADPALLACWEEKVKQGASCSLLLEHKKGVITTTLKCSSTRKAFNAEGCSPSFNSQAEKKKKKQGNKKKLKALLSYQECLVREKGLPPSNLMMQHAAANSEQIPVDVAEENQFNCGLCDFKSTSKHGVDIHTGVKHKRTEQEEPEVLRCDTTDVSPNLMEASEKREEDILPPLANSTLHTEQKEEHKSFKCKHCKRKFNSEIKLSIHVSKLHSIHEVPIGRIHKCPVCVNDQRMKPFVRNNWYIEEDLKQHMNVIHEAPEDAITFSWHGFYETVP